MYSVNKKGKPGGEKVEQAVRHYRKLKQRLAFEGENAWLTNAFALVELKLRKFGISANTL